MVNFGRYGRLEFAVEWDEAFDGVSSVGMGFTRTGSEKAREMGGGIV